jgi:hypothetical protein
MVAIPDGPEEVDIQLQRTEFIARKVIHRTPDADTHGALLEWKNPSDFHRWCLFQLVLHLLLHAVLGIGIFGFRYIKKIDIRCKAKLIIIKSIEIKHTSKREDLL